MAALPLLMACQAPTLEALYDGTVQFEGIDLTVREVAPAERHHRMFDNVEYDVCEYSSINYLNSFPMGQPFTALPVFPLRVFRHRDIWIWQGAGIESPTQLNGKRIGIQSWANSAALWQRGALVHDYGLDMASIDWVAGVPEDPRFKLPSWLRLRPKGSDCTLDQMLAAGELDAMIVPYSAQFAPEEPVQRLIPDYVAAEQDYFRRTRALPIMHNVVIKNSVLAAHPWVAESVFDGLRRALDTYVERQRVANAESALWPGLSWAEQEAQLGRQPWPCGLEANRATLETATGYATEMGLIERPVPLDELFRFEGRALAGVS